MKILIISQNHKFTNPTAISLSFKRALERTGNSCDIYDLSYYINRYLNFFIKKSNVLRKRMLEKENEKLLDFLNVNSYDAILVVKGTFLLPETVDLISKQTWIACFNPDDPFNHDSWEGSRHSNIPDSIKFYSHYFIWSHKLVNKIKQEYSIPVSYLPFAVDPLLIKEFNNLPKKYLTSFIGNGDIERQNLLSAIGEKLWLSSGEEVSVFGRYWKLSKGLKCYNGRFGDDYFKVFSETTYNINILRNQNKGATNMRTFEIPATGNLMIHEDSDEARFFFPPGKAAIYFNSSEEFIDKLEFYNKKDHLIETIRENAYKLTKGEAYTYNGRMREFLTHIPTA